MLKKITLINFMSHRETVIEPADGLTVIAGENNSGKSAIVAAIQCVCANATGDYMVRHGEKECRVILETDDGHVVEWRRANRKVSYVVDGEVIDRTRGKVPEKVELALRMGKVEAESEEFDVHFADQKSPVFLLNGTPGQRAAFFASSSDAAKLIEMQTLHKNKTANAQRDLKEGQKRETLLLGRLEKLRPIDDIEEQIKVADQTKSELDASEKEIEKLLQLVDQLKNTQDTATQFIKRADCLSRLTIPPLLTDDSRLQSLIRQLEDCQASQTDSDRTLVTLKNLAGPPELGSTNDLTKTIASIRQLNQDVARWQSVEALIQLPSVPEMADDQQGAKIKTQLANARRDVQYFEQILDLMSEEKLPPKPAEADHKVDHLAKQIVALNLEIHEVSEREKQLAKISRDATQAHDELHLALELSGTCPTCGQELKPVRTEA